jgi:ABC-type amino acid transport system permease subunit
MTTIDPEIMPVAPVEPERTIAVEGPWDWARRNLFRGPVDAVITVVATIVVAYVLYRLGRFVFVTGRWKIVRVNLRLFMVGRYPYADYWRILVSVLGIAALLGVAVGSGVQAQRRELGPPEPTSVRQRVTDVVRRTWPLLVGVGLILALTSTILPSLFVVGIVLAVLAGRVFADRVPDRYVIWTVFGATLVAGVLVWFPNGAVKPVVAVLVVAATAAGTLRFSSPPPPAVAVIGVATVVRVLIGSDDLLGSAVSIVLAVVVVAAAIPMLRNVRELPDSVAFWLALCAIPLSISTLRLLTRPVGWDSWGGLMLNLFLAVAGITLCFPLGVLLALGRRAGRSEGSVVGGVIAACILGGPLLAMAILNGIDFGETTTVVLLVMAAILGGLGFAGGLRSTLPVLRTVSVLYIELIRGAPLYVLLLVSAYALGFFVPQDMRRPDNVARAIVVFTLFTAAYIAEIVRGGLQSLPKGQVEAAQALGLTPTKTTALVVLPQALRNVIPAIVGQFISLFKDTTLAGAAFGLLEILQFREVALSQEQFDGQRLIPETIAFIAFVFWMGCITMSRESQRLEQKLGVGTR